MRVHFIAIGGSAMHNLAIALKKNGAYVSGSDDEIFEPSASRLKEHGLLPANIGWTPEKINDGIDAIILGMHARKDNPELIKAQELGLKIYSYPEFLFEKTKNKKRVVIGGSHGKTTVTSMIMHVLKLSDKSFDYMVGAKIKDFDTMVNLQEDNEIAVFEGDEYLSSPIDRRPKFLWYKPDIAVLTGIAWDHINVFQSFEEYLKQFDLFIKSFNSGASLYYYEKDEFLQKLVAGNSVSNAIGYSELDAEILSCGNSRIIYDNKEYILSIFGKHNLQNLKAAMLVCEELGIPAEEFLSAVASFKGADKRLQLITSKGNSEVYLDFAHAPSKVKATITALKEKNKKRKLLACLELHTFSSLKKEFMKEYKNSMSMADEAIVYYNPSVIKHKRLENISPDFVKESFCSDIKVFTCSNKLKTYLLSNQHKDTNILFMTSGNFDGMDFHKLADELKLI